MVTVSIFPNLAGIITLGYTNFGIYTHPQLTPILNQAIYANSVPGLSLQKNIAYTEARLILIQQGWRPNLQGEPPNLQSRAVKELFELGYEEIKDCAGTGEGPCRFEFINQKGDLLVVVAITRGNTNTKRFVRNWWIEKNPARTQARSSGKITPGIYWLGSTGQGLEVRANQYRYYDGIGQQPWKSVTDLQYVTKGVLFDGQSYWCLSTLVPTNQVASCSPTGWTQQILPFVGTRFFNFLRGSGTGQSITINQDGNTVVKLHGTMNTLVMYTGKFTNPLILEDGFGLLFQDDKIYQLKPDGKIAKGCRGEGKPCDSDLYQP
ncbi:MAG: hypothetical protein ACKPE3_39320 [Sphaerospermopsis kisseleviana]